MLLFAERHIGKTPVTVALADLDAALVLAFLDHLEHDRGNGARSRNARLAAIRSFLGYAAHHDLAALPVIERTLAVPVKRFDRPMLGFLSREETQAILDAPDTRSWVGQRDRALPTTLYNTGGARVRAGRPARRRRRPRRRPLRPPPRQGVQEAHRSLMAPHGRAAPGMDTKLDDRTETSPLFPNRAGAAMSRSNVTQRLTLCLQVLPGSRN